jgi:hypothetical protein
MCHSIVARGIWIVVGDGVGDAVGDGMNDAVGHWAGWASAAAMRANANIVRLLVQ